MWRSDKVVVKVKKVSKEKISENLQHLIQDDGFKCLCSSDQIKVETPTTFLGPFKHSLEVEKRNGFHYVTEETLAPRKFKYLIYLASICLLFFPSLSVLLFQNTFLWFLFLGTLMIWASFYTVLGNLDPVEKDFVERLENAEVVELSSEISPSIVTQLYLGILPLIVSLLVNFVPQEGIYKLTGFSLLLVPTLFLLGWKVVKRDPSRRERFGILFTGFMLQITGLVLPIISLVFLAIQIPFFSSFGDIWLGILISVVVQYLLLIWALILLKGTDKDSFAKPRAKHWLGSNPSDISRQILSDKGLAFFTFILQGFFYFGPLALLLFYIPKIQETMDLLQWYGVSQHFTLAYIVTIFLPLFLILAGMYKAIKSQAERYGSLKEKAKRSKEEVKSDKEKFVEGLFRNETKEKTFFENNNVIFSDSNDLECKTVTSGPFKRETYLIISEGMITGFSKEELKAFILHEVHHLKNDSLALVSLRYFSRFLLFGNGFLTVFVNFSLRENLADIYSARRVGREKYINALEKLREEKVKKKLSAGFVGLSLSRDEEIKSSDNWIEDLYSKIFGNYIPLYSHPSIEERIKYLKKAS